MAQVLKGIVKPAPWRVRPYATAMPQFWRSSGLEFMEPLWWGGVQGRDLVHGLDATVGGDPIATEALVGRSILTDGTGDQLTYSGPYRSDESTAAEITIGAVAVLDDNSTGRRLLYTADSTNTGFGIEYEDSVTSMRFTKGGVVGIAPADTIDPTLGNPFVFIATYRDSDGLVNFYFRDLITGEQVASTATNTQTALDGDGVIALGGSSVFNTNMWSGDITTGFIDYRFWSNADARAMMADPFAPFRPAERRVLVSVAGGGTTAADATWIYEHLLGGQAA